MNTQDIRAIAAGVVIPDGATDLKMVVVGETGGRLPDGNFSGVGGTTRYGPAWMIRGGVETSEPVALFERQRDAFDLFNLIVGPEGELWQRKERRRELLAAAAAAEEAAAAEAKLEAKIRARSETKVSSPDRASGGGSSRRSRSSATRTDTNGALASAIHRLSQPRSRRTSSQQPSSS